MHNQIHTKLKSHQMVRDFLNGKKKVTLREIEGQVLQERIDSFWRRIRIIYLKFKAYSAYISVIIGLMIVSFLVFYSVMN